jgi:hypothetical protein
LTDAISAIEIPPDRIRILSLGTGVFQSRKTGFFIQILKSIFKRVFDVDLNNTILRSNGNTLEQLRQFLLPEVICLRLDEHFVEIKHRTSFLESDKRNLEELYRLGKETFGKGDNEKNIREAFGLGPK